MEVNLPLVSVLMTSYNREKYIGEAIESVLTSTYENWELIIVDDVSEDSTVDIVHKYQSTDARIKVYTNEFNLGDYPNRNKAASYAQGKYLKYLDSDDYLLPEGLEYCVNEMEKYPEASMGMWLVKNNLNELSVVMSSEEIIREHFFKRQYLNIGPTGTIIRRDFFEANGGFDVRFKMASDNYFNLQMALNGPIVLLTQKFIFYRVHEGQQLNNPIGYLINNYLYSKEFFNKPHLPFTTKEIIYLKNKLQKRHSVNLLKFLLKTKNTKKTLEAMERTNYSFFKFCRGFFY